MNFLIPFARELLLGRGFISADRHAIAAFLGGQKNRAVGLVVGGAAESLHSYPGKNSLVLKKRKGFVKLALRTGYLPSLN
jgi:2-acylglycerol O-acyltransferase 2